jgi:hypothetical protein
MPMPQNSNLESQITFLVEVDKLKSVLRRNYVIHGDRRENSAEHSWHAALFEAATAPEQSLRKQLTVLRPFYTIMKLTVAGGMKMESNVFACSL